MKFKKGDCFYQHIGMYEYKCHIVTILEEESQIVYKYFGKHKQWWHYDICSLHSFDYGLEIGLYKLK